MPTVQPGKRSILRRVSKQMLLLLPPVRVLYQEVLLANARTAAREGELRAVQERIAGLEELLREAKNYNTRLEGDRASAEEERAALETQFLTRLIELDHYLREQSQSDAESRIDPLVAGKRDRRRKTKRRPGGGTEVLISGGSGQPNYGDEKIAISVARFHHTRGNSVWLNSFNPSVSLECFALSGADSILTRNVDYLWPPAPDDKIDSIATAIKYGLTLFDPEFDRPTRYFVDALSSIRTIHIHGGGYLNSMWPRSAFQIGAALAMKRKFGTRLFATGMGLMPLNEFDRSALAEAALTFDGFECRDRESADAINRSGLKAEAGVDDVFLELQSDHRKSRSRPDLHLCLQFSEWGTPNQNSVMNRLIHFLVNSSDQLGSIFVWEFCPKGDLSALQHPELRNLRNKIIVRNFGELVRSGLAARVGDLAIVSRFHAHLLFLRLGVRGVVVIEDGLNFGKDYYRTKHQSLLATGSNWRFLDEIERLALEAFPNVPDWREFNAVNEEKKRRCYERFFDNSASR